ncbi:hypothetical protein L376_04994 [Klebsiella pneumoniae MGH 30]|nr:hypothetical protein L376_04994 [Klebsiella pneumoniae MGH 30]
MGVVQCRAGFDMCFYLPLDITYLLAQKLRHTPAGTDNICRCVCRQVFFQSVLLTQGITQQNIPPSQECTEISDFGCRRLPAVWLLKECVTGQHIRIHLIRFCHDSHATRKLPTTVRVGQRNPETGIM